ncbi:MAG: hypothetical protein LC802_04650 [Acidobacteria bacterium]|nr:hypothetical protein [Acidobacteriota bacterium]
MKKLTVRTALVLALLCATSGSIASAKVKSKSLTFGTDFWVGNTLVKKGTYKIVFDDQTNEISIVDKTTTVAKVPAQVKKRENNKRAWDVSLVTVGDRMTLVSLAFPETAQTLVVNDAAGLAEKTQGEKTTVEKPQ